VEYIKKYPHTKLKPNDSIFNKNKSCLREKDLDKIAEDLKNKSVYEKINWEKCLYHMDDTDYKIMQVEEENIQRKLSFEDVPIRKGGGECNRLILIKKRLHKLKSGLLKCTK